MENYLYFAENLVETGGAGADQEAFMVPASYYLGADPISATSTALYFKDPVRDNGNRIKVLLTHATGVSGAKGGYKNVVRALTAAMNRDNKGNGGFVVFADEEADNATITGAATKTGGVQYDPNYDNTGPDSSTLTAGGGSVQITSDADVLAATWAAGAIGDGVAPALRRWTENGTIVTQLRLDISGLTGNGATGNDVIGVKTATPIAYLIQNTVADMGIIYRTEMSCIELPAGNNNTDINLVWNASATLDYSSAGGTTYGINGGDWVAGQTSVYETATPTADHYAYLTEGGTDGDDSVFTAGQFLITFYGHPILT